MRRLDIFGPFFAMIGLTIVVWSYMYARRLPFIVRSNLAPEQLTPLELARLSPPGVATPSDNLKNLFELPTIFYALILCPYVTGTVDAVQLMAAWAFVGFRVMHSAVHCTFNLVPLRFLLYVAGALTLWFMLLRGAAAILS